MGQLIWCICKDLECSWCCSAVGDNHCTKSLNATDLASLHFYYTSSSLLLTVCKNGGRRPGEFHYVIRGTTVICRHNSSQQLSDVQDRSCILFYKGLLSDKCETTQKWRNHFMEQKDSTILSCATYITAILQQLSFVYMFYLFSWACFSSSFSVAVDINANKPLCLESVKLAVPWITWWSSLGLLPPFLHTASNQKLEV